MFPHFVGEQLNISEASVVCLKGGPGHTPCGSILATYLTHRGCPVSPKASKNRENWIAYLVLILFFAYLCVISYIGAMSAGNTR
jgi:hypothetical protein